MATENPHKTFLDQAESISKMGAISFAAIYAIGYLVTSLHLSHYGIVSAELFKIQYVVTGVWAIIPPTIIIFLIVTGIGFYSSIQKEEIADEDTSPSSVFRRIGNILWAILKMFSTLMLFTGLFYGTVWLLQVAEIFAKDVSFEAAISTWYSFIQLNLKTLLFSCFVSVLLVMFSTEVVG